MNKKYKSSKKILLSTIITFSIVISILIILNLENKDDYSIKVTGAPYTIVTTSNTITSMVNIIIDGAENVTLNTMTDKNVYELIDYTLTDQDYELISKSDVIYCFGTENFLTELKEQYNDKYFIELFNDNMSFMKNESNEDCLYCWLSPVTYNIAIGNIAYNLSSYNSKDIAFYQKNANKYIDNKSQLIYEHTIDLFNQKNTLLIGDNMIYIKGYFSGNVFILPANITISEISKILEENNIQQIITENNEDYKILEKNLNGKYDIFSLDDLCELPSHNSYEKTYSDFIKFLNK